MGRKFEITGKAVIYTEAGGQVVDCETRRYFNAHADGNDFRFKNLEGNYLLVGGARTVPSDNPYAAEPRPELVEQALNYTRTKFFRLMLDLQRLAQFEPIHKANRVLEYQYWSENPPKSDIDFSTSVADLDAQLYRKLGFTQEMIDFTEARYSYDDLR